MSKKTASELLEFDRREIEKGGDRTTAFARFGMSERSARGIVPAGTRGGSAWLRNPMDQGALDLSLEGEETISGFLFMELEAGQCKFSIGKDAETGAYRFCGEPSELRGPYC